MPIKQRTQGKPVAYLVGKKEFYSIEFHVDPRVLLRGEPFDWDVNFGAWSSTIEPHWMNQIWREDSIPSLNAGAYVSKKVEELFNQGVREFDREKRKAIYQEIQSILSTDAPYVFLTFNLSYTGVNKRIGGIEPTAVGIGYNRDRWFIK